LVAFSSRFTLEHFQFLHDLEGSWQVHTGDFAGEGQAQLLFYNTGTGDAQILKLKKDLSVASRVDFFDWGTGQVLYIGHFGLPALSVMLYDPQQAQSTFIALDGSFNISHQYTARSWGQSEQILVGSFLNRVTCLAQNTCGTGDDILVLDRTTGYIQQYVFSFGNQFGVFDNRAQGFIREGIAVSESVLPVDATLFSLFNSLGTAIHNEELY